MIADRSTVPTSLDSKRSSHVAGRTVAVRSVAPQAASRVGAPLVLSSLVRTFAGGSRGVDEVSLAVAAGELVTLLGPSGSGKTTTLKMVAGFERPDAGRIRLGEHDITEAPPHRRDIGMVFQNYALFPHMTVADNIGFALRMRRRPGAEVKAAIERMLELVHLPGFGGRFPRQLSGGQQQRVALARALIFSPSLLLMDEPLGALDRLLRRQVQSEIKRLQRQLGTTVLFVTHDQDEALFLSDRIAVMNEGRIAQVGPPLELYARPADRFVAEFLGEPNVLTGTLAGTEDRYLRIRLPGGPDLRGCAMVQSGLAGPVDVLIRPERLSVASSEAGSDANYLPMRIELVNFLGESLEIEARTGSGSAVRVRMPWRADLPQFAPGDVVTASASPEDCLIFPALVFPARSTA
jgi:putative spermidine/putrescine transport system ATP-binding protein